MFPFITWLNAPVLKVPPVSMLISPSMSKEAEPVVEAVPAMVKLPTIFRATFGSVFTPVPLKIKL